MPDDAQHLPQDLAAIEATLILVRAEAPPFPGVVQQGLRCEIGCRNLLADQHRRQVLVGALACSSAVSRLGDAAAEQFQERVLLAAEEDLREVLQHGPSDRGQRRLDRPEGDQERHPLGEGSAPRLVLRVVGDGVRGRFVVQAGREPALVPRLARERGEELPDQPDGVPHLRAVARGFLARVLAHHVNQRLDGRAAQVAQRVGQVRLGGTPLDRAGVPRELASSFAVGQGRSPCTAGRRGQRPSHRTPPSRREGRNRRAVTR